MKKVFKNRGLFFVLIVLWVLFFIALGYRMFGYERQNNQKAENYNASASLQKSSDRFLYKGKTGENALTLLKQYATVSLDQSGMVSSVNGRKADSGKHEYWAFYVNGKFANVGSADYKTNDSDLIEWRIEKY